MQAFRHVLSAWSTDGVWVRLWQVQEGTVHCALCQAPLPPGSLCTRLRSVQSGSDRVPYCTGCVAVRVEERDTPMAAPTPVTHDQEAALAAWLFRKAAWEHTPAGAAP